MDGFDIENNKNLRINAKLATHGFIIAVTIDFEVNASHRSDPMSVLNFVVSCFAMFAVLLLRVCSMC